MKMKSVGSKTFIISPEKIIASEIPVGEKSATHLRFTDVSGKSKSYNGIDFSYSILERGYFHNARFENCKFNGVRFVDCIFRNAEFINCDFSYSDFSGTIVPWEQMFSNLPDFPNIRRSLLQSLRKNAVSIGDYEAEKRIVLKEIDAKKEHLRFARLQETSYYQTKYGGVRKQTQVCLQSLGLFLENWVWGHGERLFLFPLFLVVLSILLALAHILMLPEVSAIPVGDFFNKIIYVSFELLLNFVNVEVQHSTDFNLFINVIIELTKYLIWGVIAATLYRRLSHR